MADEPEDDVLDLTNDMREDEPEQHDESEAFHIEIEGEEEGQVGDVNAFRRMRAELAERNRTIAELKQKVAPKPVEVGDEPDIEDFDYDKDKWKAAHREWMARSRQAEASEEAEKRRKDSEEQVTQKFINAYVNSRAKLPVADFEQVEAVVRDGLSEQQKADVIRYADDPAKAVYALGKYPSKLIALAAIDDRGEFIKAVSKLEASITVGMHKPKPPKPEMETVQSGSAPLSGGGDYDKQLAKLEKEWENSGGGSRAKISAFKRAHKEKAK